MSNIPAGFELVTSSHPFGTLVGPVYHCQLGEGIDDWKRGFLVEKKHCNRIGFCHAGMMSFFADVVLGQSFWNHGYGPCVLMEITTDHCWPIRHGDWVEGTSRITKVEGNTDQRKGIIHTEATMYVGNHCVLKCKAKHRQIKKRLGAWDDFPK